MVVASGAVAASVAASVAVGVLSSAMVSAPAVPALAGVVVLAAAGVLVDAGGSCRRWTCYAAGCGKGSWNPGHMWCVYVWVCGRVCVHVPGIGLATYMCL